MLCALLNGTIRLDNRIAKHNGREKRIKHQNKLTINDSEEQDKT